MEITKQEAKSLRMKMRNAVLYLKGAAVICSLKLLAAACRKIVPTSVNVGKTRPTGSTASTGENFRASFQLITRRLNVDTKVLRLTTLR